LYQARFAASTSRRSKLREFLLGALSLADSDGPAGNEGGVCAEILDLRAEFKSTALEILA